MLVAVKVFVVVMSAPAARYWRGTSRVTAGGGGVGRAGGPGASWGGGPKRSGEGRGGEEGRIRGVADPLKKKKKIHLERGAPSTKPGPAEVPTHGVANASQTWRWATPSHPPQDRNTATAAVAAGRVARECIP